MQQTNKYKLNLIESSDPFLPDGLNANTQKVEDVLSEQLGGMEAQLDSFVQKLGIHGHNARMIYGTYTGDGQYGEAAPSSMTFDFYPMVLIVNTHVMLRGVTSVLVSSNGTLGTFCRPTWKDRTVTWFSRDSAGAQLNNNGTLYHYLAIGYDPEA